MGFLSRLSFDMDMEPKLGRDTTHEEFGLVGSKGGSSSDEEF